MDEDLKKRPGERPKQKDSKKPRLDQDGLQRSLDKTPQKDQVPKPTAPGTPVPPGSWPANLRRPRSPKSDTNQGQAKKAKMADHEEYLASYSEMESIIDDEKLTGKINLIICLLITSKLPQKLRTLSKEITEEF